MKQSTKHPIPYGEDYFTRGNYRGYTKIWYRFYHVLKYFTVGCYYKYILGVRSILDIGCATGMSVFVFRKFLHLDAYGVDISRYAVRMAPKSVRPFVFCGDCTKKDSIFWKRPYDLVVSYDVLEHLTQKQVDRLIKHMFTVTRHAIVGIYVRDELIASIHRGIGFIHTDHILERDVSWWKEYLRNKDIIVDSIPFSRKGSLSLRIK